MKYSSIIGILASTLLIVSCFLPWTFYPDLEVYFTGFFSQQNMYGRPGMMMMIFAIISIILFATPRVWAKRANWVVVTLAVAYTVKTYFLFTSCYNGICPVKQMGIFLMILSVAVMFICAILPDIKLRN